MPRLQDVIKIVTLEEFETLALRVGNDPITRFELVKAITDINSLMEGADLLYSKHRRKK
jgi:hypothetical protein